MNCPHCNTPNDPTSEFCVNCGRPLHDSNPGLAGYIAYPGRTAGESLGILTARLLLAVLGVWLIRYILLGLSFIENLLIPDSTISAGDIINVLAYLAIIALLLVFARDFGNLWPGAFSSYPELGYLLTALIYVGILAAVYAGLSPLFAEFAAEPDVILVFQVALAILVLIIVIRAAFIAYFGLAGWLTRLISGMRAGALKESSSAETATQSTKPE